MTLTITTDGTVSGAVGAVAAIQVACTDHSGNTATGVTTVRVDRSKGK